MKICTTISSLIFKLKFSLFSSEGFCASKIQQIKSQLKRITSPPAGSVPAPYYRINQTVKVNPSTVFVIKEALFDGTEWSYFGEYTDIDTKRYSKIELMESALRSASLRRL